MGSGAHNVSQGNVSELAPRPYLLPILFSLFVFVLIDKALFKQPYSFAPTLSVVAFMILLAGSNDC